MKPGYKIILWYMLAVSLISAYPALSARLTGESENRAVAIVADYSSFIRQLPKDDEGYYEGVQRTGSMNAGDLQTLRKLKDSGVTAIALDVTEAGFDTGIMDEASSMGFDIMLVLKNGTSLASVLPAGYEEAFRKDRVRYISFQGAILPGYPRLSELQTLIRNCSLIVALSESPDQTGLTEPEGLDGILSNLRYPANRMYVIPDADLSALDSDGLFHRWLRAVVDRSIRFIYVKPLQGNQSSAATASGIISCNYDTLWAVKSLQAYISSHRYTVGEVLYNVRTRKTAGFFYVMLIVSIFLGLLLYLEYLCDPDMRGKRGISIRVAAVSLLFAASACLIRTGTIQAADFISVSASILYPSLSSLMLMIYLKKYAEKPLLLNVTVSIALILVINLAGAFTISASMSEIRYTMGFETFKGVVLIYTIPVILTVVNYFRVMAGQSGKRSLPGIPGEVGLEGRAGKRALKQAAGIGLTGRKLLTPVNLALFAVFIILLAVYLLRSVTEGIVKAGSVEIAVRDFLETTMVVRPRFKEFLAGWPSLFAFVFIVRGRNAAGRNTAGRSTAGRNTAGRNSPLLLLLSIGIVIGGISIVDSFCHTFTAVSVSFHRTINGLVLGLAVGVLILLSVHILQVLRYDGFITNNNR